MDNITSREIFEAVNNWSTCEVDQNIIEDFVNEMRLELTKSKNISEHKVESEWIEITDSSNTQNIPVGRDFMCKFDDDTIHNFYGDLPTALMTHWRELKPWEFSQ